MNRECEEHLNSNAARSRGSFSQKHSLYVVLPDKIISCKRALRFLTRSSRRLITLFNLPRAWTRLIGWTVMCSETTDISNVEQLSISARYLDGNCIREDFFAVRASM